MLNSTAAAGRAFHGEVAFLAEHRVREEARKAGGATGAQRERGHGETRGHLENLQQVRVGVPGVLLQDRGEAVPEASLARVADRDYLRKGVLDGDRGRA